MTTGEVIYPEFGRKRSAPSADEPQAARTAPAVQLPESPIEAEALLEDLQYLAGHKPRLMQVRDRIDTFLEYRRSIPTSEDDQRIQEQRQGMRALSLEYLADLILQSGQREWQKAMHYYSALVLAYDNRAQRLMNLFPER